ncbi:hypothetical protein [Agrobacterium pusense]|uniref:hypothetical protein n=1 Tax=Agrobacterium pusense TaxID=648995 RepID=UPI0005143C18|nr:hypothetical protein [Agrobacterium pusense]ANV25015.1 hypothetical protein BA939_14420 [Rhizobium sp. S41]KGE79822.1 hypothetical protein LW14_26815 [Rhizobium sp. H41]QWW74181.1 hypothetical protein KP800_01365 [Agrobacterium pusense]
MITRITRQKNAEQRLAMALRQMNDAIKEIHKTGLDVEVSTLQMMTSRGDMKQFDIRTFRAEGAPPVLKVVGD